MYAVGILLILALGLSILLNNNKIQNRIADKLTSNLSERLHTKVSVGDVHYRFFNTFKFDRLYVEDLNKDTLLYVEKAYADFDFWNFFNGKYTFYDIELDNIHGNLVIDEKGKSNIDFIIQSFKSEEEKSKDSNFELNFSQIKISDSRLLFTDYSQKVESDNKLFNPHRLDFKDINAKVSLDYLMQDSISAKILALSVREKSGLSIKNLTTSIHGWKRGIFIPNLLLDLPNSHLQLSSLKVSCDSLGIFNDLLYKSTWKAKINPSSIHLNDLKPLFPNSSHFTQALGVQGDISGNLSNLKIKNFNLRYGDNIGIDSDIELNGLPNINETFIYADIYNLKANRSGLQDLISQIQGKAFFLPEEIARFGNIEYKGKISGFFSDLVTYGTFKTDVGLLATDISVRLSKDLLNLNYNGKIKSDNFQLRKLLQTEVLGSSSFLLEMDGSKLHNEPFKGIVKGKIKQLFVYGYNYEDIDLEGEYDGSKFNGELNIDDKNIFADFNGLVDFSKEIPEYNFDLAVNNVNLHQLKLIDEYEDSNLSFHLSTNFAGKNLDELNGFFLIDSISFKNKNKSLFVDQINLNSTVSNDSTSILVTSDFVNGTIDGSFKYSTLFDSFNTFVANYLPALVTPPITTNSNTENHKNIINVNLALNNTDSLFSILELPIKLGKNTTIKAVFDENKHFLDVKSDIYSLNLKNGLISDLSVNLNNQNNKLNLQALGNYHQENEIYKIKLNSNAASNIVSTSIAWANSNNTNKNDGEIQTQAIFSKNEQELNTLIKVLPTQFSLNGSIWSISPAEIVFLDKNKISLKDIKIANENQYIKLNGIASKNEEDKLHINMNQLDVGYLVRLSGLKDLTLEGLSTGKMDIYSVLEKPSIESDLIINNTKLNDAPLGDLWLNSGWDKEKSAINFKGGIVSDNKLITDAKGLYSLEKDSLFIDFATAGLPIKALKRYLTSFARDVDGKIYGDVTLSVKNGDIGLNGKVLLKDALLQIDYTEAKYHFTDSVKITKKTFEFEDITVYDEENNTAKVNAMITHNGHFVHFTYDVDVLAQNFIGFDGKMSDDKTFYGKGYITGTARIYGADSQTVIEANVTTNKKTNISFLTSSSRFASQNDGFITFIDKKNDDENKNPSKDNNTKEKKSQQGGNLSVNLQVAATPDANVQLIINPLTNDLLSVNGKGDIRIDFNSKNNVPNMYGNYTISEGSYNFTLQNFIRKDFKISQGSNIIFSGDISRARLDIDAIYSLTASLRDLLDQNIISASTGRTSIPVNVHIGVTNEIEHPTIAFDISLPSSDEALKMQVKDLINTEEIMNRQVVYLLLFNKFYSPIYGKDNENLATNTSVSFLTSTLSGQLNNWLGQLTNNVSLGVNYRASTYGSNVSQEYEAEVSLQPSRRFLINGNIGYRDDDLAKNKIIGDLDVEYLLTNNGKWRIRAYNHTFDRYSLRSAPFIQGVGIMYKEEFSTWHELWKDYRRKKNKTSNPIDSVKTQK